MKVSEGLWYRGARGTENTLRKKQIHLTRDKRGARSYAESRGTRNHPGVLLTMSVSVDPKRVWRRFGVPFSGYARDATDQSVRYRKAGYDADLVDSRQLIVFNPSILRIRSREVVKS